MAFRCTGLLVAAAWLLLAAGCSTEDPPLGLDFPPTVAEGESPVGTIRLPEPAQADLQVTLETSDPDLLSAPATVIVPAGRQQESFTASAVENTYLDAGHLTVTLTLSAPEYPSTQVSVVLSDNESSILTVTLPPSVSEGGASVMGTVELQPGVVTRYGLDIGVVSSVPTAVTVQGAVHIAPGSGTVGFDIFPEEDDNDVSEVVEITASHPDLVGGSATLQALDDD
jgi:hypothetical protein